MGSAGGQTPTKPNISLYLFFFSILRHIKQDKVNIA
jgi:hypothetical protein